MLSFRYLRIGNNHGEDGPIHEAALRGSLDEVRRLIMDSPFILNLKGADSRSPLTYAVWSGNVALVTYLVNRGASVFEKDEAGAVPLHHAAFHGFPEVVDYLVDKGTDVNVSDNDKCTPLFYAAYAGHLETVQMLLYLGSDSGVLNKEGKNAMDVACIGGNRKNREAILSALSAGYNLRRDREERQRLREELKNRLAIEAKDSAAQRKREEDARREAAARKRREQDERQRAEAEEKEAEVQWRLHEEKTKKFKDTQTKMDASLRSNAPTPSASAFFPIPSDQAPDTNSFYYQSQTPGATRMLVHHDSANDVAAANNGPPSSRASPHSYHPVASPVPHHSDASLGPEAYRRPVTPYSDGPSRAEQPDYRRAASPHGPPPQPYDNMPPVDAYGRPRYPGWYEDPHHMAPRYSSPPPPEMGPYGPPQYGPPQRPPMWDYDYPRPTPRAAYYGPYDPAYGPPRYPSPSPYAYGPMPHPEEYRRPHTAPESARYSPYGGAYSPGYGPPGPYEHPPLSHRWAPPEEGEYTGRPSTARRSYDHPPYSARFREGGYPSSGRDVHRDRELEEVYARYEEEKRARERLEREREEREIALAEQSRWRKEVNEDGGRREAHHHRVSSSGPPTKETAPTPAAKAEAAPEADATPKPACQEAAVPPARLGRKPTPPVEEETEKGGPITNLPIHVSTLSGNLGEVKRLITDRPGLVHKRGLYLRTPLLCAASRGHFEVLKFLVEEGAPIEVVDEIKWSALHHAAGNGYAAIIRYLVEQGLDVNARDKYEWTPLYRAAYNGHVEAVKTLLELGADRTLRDEKGKSPLQMACTGANKQNKEVIISILESEAPPRRVSVAAPAPVPAPVEAPVSAPVEAAPIVAALAETGSKNDAAEVEAAAKAEADNKAKTEAASAASAADAAKAKADADAKAKAEADAKVLAEKVKAINAADALPLAGPAKNQPVHSAAFKGKIDDVKRIVGENPLAANARGDLLRTPLMLASGAGHIEVAKYLLDEGAQLEAKDEWQGRALHMAALYGHDKVVDLLVERGADVNATAKHGCTALYYAAYNGHALAVKTLLANGAEKSLGDEKGKNAQAVACDGGNAANKTALLSLFTMPADKLKAK